MNTVLSLGFIDRLKLMRSRDAAVTGPRASGLAWSALPRAAQFYVAVIIIAGGAVAIEWFPVTYPRPALCILLLAAVCVTAVWKVNLPIALTSGSTLSVSYAPKLMALLLLGPGHAVILAMIGAGIQSTYKTKLPYPVYRTVWNMN